MIKAKPISISFDQQSLQDIQTIRKALERSYLGNEHSDLHNTTFTNSFIVRSALRFYADTLKEPEKK